MAAIWELPVVFVIENNHYGMGTSDRRAAKSAQYYTRGDYIPGVWVDGMDALSVKSATAFAKDYVLKHGPLMLEMVRPSYCPHQLHTLQHRKFGRVGRTLSLAHAARISLCRLDTDLLDFHTAMCCGIL